MTPMEKLVSDIRLIFEKNVVYRKEPDEYVIVGTCEDLYKKVMNTFVEWLKKAMKVG